MPPADLQWDTDSSIRSDKGVTEGAGQAQGTKPVERQTRQAVRKQAVSKGPQPSGKRRKMVRKKKEKAVPSTAAPTMSVSDPDEESDTPSPDTKKKKSELHETTAADAARVKEALKVKILGGSYEDASAPLPPLRPKFWMKLKSTL